MTQITLSQATQAAINTAVNDGPGANNANYVAAYNAIHGDIQGTSIDSGTQYWFSLAGSINGQAFTPSAAGRTPRIFNRRCYLYDA